MFPKNEITRTLDNVVPVNDMSNIPVQDATTWTAQAGVEYQFGAKVTTDKQCIAENGSVLSGNSPFNEIYEYTGTGTAFKSVDSTWQMRKFGYSVPNGTIFDVSGEGSLQLIDALCFSCEHVGTISRATGAVTAGLLISRSGIVGINTSGLVLDSEFLILSISSFIMRTANPLVKFIDYTAATFEDFEISNLELRGPIGAEGLVGAANSSNMIDGAVGTIRDSTLGLPGTITPLGGGLLPADEGFDYSGTPAVISSKVVGFTFVTTPALTDVLDGVDVQIAGTFTQGSISSQASSDVAGTITLHNRIEKRGNVSVDIDLSKVGGSSKQYLIKIRKKPLGGATVDVEGAFNLPTLAGGGSSTFSISTPTNFIDTDEYIVTIQGVAHGEDVTATATGFKVTE